MITTEHQHHEGHSVTVVVKEENAYRARIDDGCTTIDKHLECFDTEIVSWYCDTCDMKLQPPSHYEWST